MIHSMSSAKAQYVSNGKGSMRKIPEAISLAALVFQVWIVCGALYGASRLPERVPIHFDMAGHPNGWGSPSTFLVLPFVTVAVYLLLTIVARFPASFNYAGVEVTNENRPRLQALTINMLAWTKMEMVCTFLWVQWATIQAARHMVAPSLPALIAPLGVLFITVAWFIVAMLKAGRSKPSF
jgi:uncharacterized membrane protein